MRSTTARRGLALLAATLLSATLLLAASVSIVLADSPLPSSINASVGGGTGATPTGAVQGVSGGDDDGAGAVPGEGYFVSFQQQTPSGIVMILILLLGVAASLVIMTLSKRTNGTP